MKMVRKIGKTLVDKLLLLVAGLCSATDDIGMFRSTTPKQEKSGKFIDTKKILLFK